MSKDSKALTIGDRIPVHIQTFAGVDLALTREFHPSYDYPEDDYGESFAEPPDPPEGHWRTAKGTVIKIEEMNNGHLHNAYRMLDRGGFTAEEHSKMRELGYEIRKRNVKMLAP